MTSEWSDIYCVEECDCDECVHARSKFEIMRGGQVSTFATRRNINTRKAPLTFAVFLLHFSALRFARSLLSSLFFTLLSTITLVVKTL